MLAVMLVCLTLSLTACGGEMTAKPFEANVSVDTENHSLHYVEMTIAVTLGARPDTSES